MFCPFVSQPLLRDWDDRKYYKLVSGDEVFVDTKDSRNQPAEGMRPGTIRNPLHPSCHCFL